MRRISRTLTLLTLVLVVPACGAGATDPFGVLPGQSATPPGDKMTADELAWAHDVLVLTNAQREQSGLPPLEWDDRAAQVAFGHCADMRNRGFFDHTNPDGESPGDRLAEGGILDTGWGENIARGQDDPGEVVQAWMDSPGHRENIVRDWFTELGVGVHIGPGGPWWAQAFLGR